MKHDGGRVTSWACMAARTTGSLVFIDDVTNEAAGWILRLFRATVFYLLRFSQMLLKLTGWRFTVHMYKGVKLTVKSGSK